MPGTNLTRQEAAARAETVAVDAYEVVLDLTRGERVFRSTTTVRFRATPGASTFIDAITDAVHSVVLNGTELDPAEVSDGVRIQLPGLAADNVLTVESDCRYMNTGEGLHRFVDPADGEIYVYAQSFLDDAQRIFGCFDQPDLKATFALSVDAPPTWTVVGNARGARVGDRWQFAPTERIGSTASASPSTIAGPRPRRPTLGTLGGMCISVPMPCPV